MELLTKKFENTFDRLVRYADGKRALATIALAKYNSGEIDDVLDYIDETLGRPSPRTASKPPNKLEN